MTTDRVPTGMTCDEATMRLLARHGVTTLFGIPGAHTLDLCRGLTGGQNSGAIAHVQCFADSLPLLLISAKPVGGPARSGYGGNG